MQAKHKAQGRVPNLLLCPKMLCLPALLEVTALALSALHIHQQHLHATPAFALASMLLSFKCLFMFLFFSKRKNKKE